MGQTQGAPYHKHILPTVKTRDLHHIQQSSVKNVSATLPPSMSSRKVGGVNTLCVIACYYFPPWSTYSTVDAPPPDLLAPLTAPSSHLFVCGFLPHTSRTPPLSMIVGGVGGNCAGMLKEISSQVSSEVSSEVPSRVLSRDNEAPYSRKFAATTAQGRLHKTQEARGETDR